jgi:hypothetical protein
MISNPLLKSRFPLFEGVADAVRRGSCFKDGVEKVEWLFGVYEGFNG